MKRLKSVFTEHLGFKFVKTKLLKLFQHPEEVIGSKIDSPDEELSAKTKAYLPILDKRISKKLKYFAEFINESQK